MTTLNATLSGTDGLDIDLELAATSTVIPPPNLPPDPDRRWRRVSLVFGAPTVVDGQATWDDPEIIDQAMGQLQVVVDGRDVSQFRGIPTLVKNWESNEPGGDVNAVIVFPAITAHDHVGSGDLAWLRDRAHVELWRVRTDGTRKRLWVGQHNIGASDYDDTSSTFTSTCIGALYQADDAVQLAGFDTTERDIGVVIPDALTSVVSRDYQACPRVTTGIKTRQRGAGTPRLTGYCFDLLATATAANGLDQWTVTNDGWQPRMRLKDRSTVHCTMRAGQAGLAVQLRGDVSSAPKVILGEGTRADGMRWRNTKYPNQRLDDAPLFPLDPGAHFSPGGGTGGFAALAYEMRDNGYRMYSGDTYDSRDEDEIRDAQARGGVTVNGQVNANTWATIFGVGSNVGSTAGAFQAPLVLIPLVDPYLWDVRGRKLGPNPAYNPNVPRIERYESMGEGIDLATGKLSARRELARTSVHKQFGTLVLTGDPNEMSRHEIRAGMNFLLQGHHGSDRMLHIAGASVDWLSDKQPVTLTVDELNRDLLTLQQLIGRNRESATDPTRRPSSQRRRSREITDTLTPWDGEAGAGRIPRHAVTAGQWLVLKIPAGQAGTVTEIRMLSSGPNSEYVLAVFGQPVTSAQLHHYVPDPLSADRPFDDSFDRLRDDLWMAAAWGGSSNPVGYSPKAKGDSDAVLNGRLIDDGGFSYETAVPGWLWVAEYVATSCYLEGQLTAGVEGV
ncbi:MAG: peptidoglycan-binding protein [Frankiales bacterium]|nr:peptidoglycan-binding protein [Frankiales bacterium]